MLNHRRLLLFAWLRDPFGLLHGQDVLAASALLLVGVDLSLVLRGALEEDDGFARVLLDGARRLLAAAAPLRCEQAELLRLALLR